MQPLLLNINEVAAALGVGRRTAYALRTRSDFPKAVTLAKLCVRYRASDVQRFVERLAAARRPAPEPERLKAGKQANRGSAKGLQGELQTAASGKPRRGRARSEPPGFEPKTGRNSNLVEAARK
jgi:predicted DNA-binding transcriptional regulator AlpA